MKIAHVGAIAANALINARDQRARGLEADCFDLGAGPAGWTPYWEWGDWTVPNLSASEAYDWRQIPMINGYQRPPWAKSLGWTGGPAWFDALDDRYYELMAEHVRVKRPPPSWHHPIPGLRRDLRAYHRWEPMHEIALNYELMVLYGPEAGYGVTLPRGLKYVTFECSTMRSVPLLRDASQRVLAHAYQGAAANIITNADCHGAALELGVADKSHFIPHPIDLDKFHPQPPEVWSTLREKLLEKTGAKVLFLAPARQQKASDPDAKGNAKILAAFAKYVHESEPRGAPRAALLLLQWGSNLPEVDAWIDALNITEHVVWVRPMHKTRLVPLYAAVDVVIDQFSEKVGSYGTTTVEALAMGKPVITWIDRNVHRWCEDVIPIPPHHGALTTWDIYQAMVTLATSAEARHAAGEAGVKWAQTWCSAERIQALNVALYERVLA